MRTAAVLCTYNEAQALPDVLSRLKQALPKITLLVIDDDSPDGTTKIAESAGAFVRVRRGVPRGRGLAGIAGYRWALTLDVDAILEMDADGSHDPAQATRLLDALAQADIAVGSRDAKQGGRDERPMIRRALSAAAKWILKMMLRLPLEDPTSGYRAFRIDALKKIDPETLKSEGPEIVEEIYLRARRLGLTMTEVPIVFQNRAAGVSKLTPGKLVRVLWRCLRMSFA